MNKDALYVFYMYCSRVATLTTTLRMNTNFYTTFPAEYTEYDFE